MPLREWGLGSRQSAPLPPQGQPSLIKYNLMPIKGHKYFDQKKRPQIQLIKHTTQHQKYKISWSLSLHSASFAFAFLFSPHFPPLPYYFRYISTILLYSFYPSMISLYLLFTI